MSLCRYRAEQRDWPQPAPCAFELFDVGYSREHLRCDYERGGVDGYIHIYTHKYPKTVAYLSAGSACKRGGNGFATVGTLVMWPRQGRGRVHPFPCLRGWRSTAADAHD
jgi:hypothetical protein